MRFSARARAATRSAARVARDDSDETPVGVFRSPLRNSEELIPRRSRSYAETQPWWRPRGRIGLILLGTALTAVVSAVAFAGVVVQRFLTHDSRFLIAGVASIATNGLSEVSRAELLPVFGEDIGRNLFFVSLDTRRHQLEAIPWVKSAVVMRELPDRLQVDVVERTPVAFVRAGEQVELADADGVLLQMAPLLLARHHYSFPVVSGITAAMKPEARTQRMAAYLRFLAELDHGGQHLSQQVSEVDVSDPEDLRAVIPESGADVLAHFGDGDFLHRWQIYQAHIAEWRARYPRLIGVDLRYAGEIPLEMATDTPAQPPAQASIAAAQSASKATAISTTATAVTKKTPATSNKTTASSGKGTPANSKTTSSTTTPVASARTHAAAMKLKQNAAARRAAQRRQTLRHNAAIAARRQSGQSGTGQ